jgi:inosine/xanthosine triphosphatase
MSDSETLLGAKNRIKNAKKIHSQADFWVGVEGGLEKNDNKLEAFAYIIIESNNKTGISKTATFTIPDKLSDLIYNGVELGHADDIVFGGTNSKQKNGSVGILTKNLITRLTFYEQSVILALIPFLNTDLY